MDSGVNKAIHLLQQETIKLKDEISTLREENEALRSYMKGITALYNATQHIVSQDNVFKLLDEILYQALTIIDADHGSLLLVDEDTEELVFVVVHGAYRESLRGYRMNWHQGIAGWVVKNGEPLIVNHAHFDPRFSSEIDQVLGFTTKEILAVPLKFDERILGVIELVNKHNDLEFTESDATILSLLGIFAAFSLEQMERQLEESE